MKSALVVMVVILAGCAASPAELAAEDDAACTGYGFTRQTADYAACRMHVAQARESRDTMKRASLFMGRPRT